MGEGAIGIGQDLRQITLLKCLAPRTGPVFVSRDSCRRLVHIGLTYLG